MVKINVKKPELKELMIKKGFNQAKLGREIGITKSYVSQLVNGNTNPSPVLAKKITDKLNVNFDDIFFIESGSFSVNTKRN
ncbi:helix-turn-helix transcriptional regulator [Evansella cellulosilytica]|uniref:Helix-turn-helix domain protein n=1 Tax=Evansella cellulosilytica (strain ATCC 21833 / DSM 2522 / FERM P-1141 / JCM 9156 / N-4) TaxID=649639 RepID=E6TVI9_EVAC2|nr:helix-turn-helix transcriptional regulator [Evansella cellulosilytica]ADU31006.1 helix-turn-helix domain protein [Evansella cellulosilytica DSM 2522]